MTTVGKKDIATLLLLSISSVTTGGEFCYELNDLRRYIPICEDVSSARQSVFTPRASLGHTNIRYNRYRERTPRVTKLLECEFNSSAKPVAMVQCTRMNLHVPVSRKVLRHFGYFHFRNVMMQQNRDDVAASLGRASGYCGLCASDAA